MKRMTRTTMAAAVTMFALAPCFANAAMQADQSSDSQAAVAKPTPPGISLRKFAFTIVLGDMLTGVTGSTFTPAEAKALADLKGFLPYKRYTLLDTVYKIGPSGPSTQVKGIDEGQKYELFTNGTGMADGKRMSMRVWLRGAPGSERPTLLIDTGFEMDFGETVVVGTSRLDGNRALLLLVTSVP